MLPIRAEVEARYSRIIEGVRYSPYLSLGLIDDLAGGGSASGVFSTGSSFELSLDGEDELKARAGLGFDAGFENGSTVSIAYHGETSGTSAAHMLEAEIRVLW